MPISRSSAQRTIQVTPVLPTRLSISAPGTVLVGQWFTVSGKLEFQDVDGIWKPLAGRPIDIFVGMSKAATVTTDTSGNYSLQLRILSTGTFNIVASYVGEADFFPSDAITTVNVVEPTLPSRISISAPDRVRVGQLFTISGKLEFQDVDGVWKPLGNQPVSLLWDNNIIGVVTTASDGTYTKPDAQIGVPGTFTLTALFEGTGRPRAVIASRVLAVEGLKSWASVAAPIALGVAASMLGMRARSR
jgi:hypothetical protein